LSFGFDSVGVSSKKLAFPENKSPCPVADCLTVLVVGDTGLLFGWLRDPVRCSALGFCKSSCGAVSDGLLLFGCSDSVGFDTWTSLDSWLNYT